MFTTCFQVRIREMQAQIPRLELRRFPPLAQIRVFMRLSEIGKPVVLHWLGHCRPCRGLLCYIHVQSYRLLTC
jgi:hypothetical protein